MEKKMTEKYDKLERLMEDVKSLLILQLVKSGLKSEEIGKCLGVDGSTIRHIIGGTKKKSKKNGKEK